MLTDKMISSLKREFDEISQRQPDISEAEVSKAKAIFRTLVKEAGYNPQQFIQEMGYFRDRPGWYPDWMRRIAEEVY